MVQKLSRRRILGSAGLAGLAGGAALVGRTVAGDRRSGSDHGHEATPEPGGKASPHAELHGSMFPKGEVDHKANGFHPTDMLHDFDYGRVSRLPSGQTLRDYTIVASNKMIEVIPGVMFSAWAYNDRVPGPTIRAIEGDRIRITFINGSDHPHSIHFHGIHDAVMDGVTPVKPGETFVYEFDAEPFGVHLYHCHVPPFMRHIHRGLYGMFIVDPKTQRAPAHEMMMVMNAFDTNFDSANEVYAVNTVGFHYTKEPIPLKLGELNRIYLSNFIEFDLINSFHLHANLFNYFDTGTSLSPTVYTDVIMQAQAQRGIIEFTYNRPGVFMFHAHVSEFNQLGWMGLFEVSEQGTAGMPNVTAREVLGFDLA